MALPPPSEKKQTIVFTHEADEAPGVKTRMLKMFHARFGGKLTIIQSLTEGGGLGSLYVGSSNIPNPTPEQVMSITEPVAWSSESTVVCENDLVLYPFLVLSADFTDTELAKVEVELTFSWSPLRGR